MIKNIKSNLQKKKKKLRKKRNLRMTASMEVKAGVNKLPMAEARVGELYSMPIYPHN